MSASRKFATILANGHAFCFGIYGNPFHIIPLLEGRANPAVGTWSNFDAGEDRHASSVWWHTNASCGINP